MSLLTRRQVLRRGAVAAAIVAAPRTVLSATRNLIAARPPNIIFLLTDDQRADSLSCAGNPVLKTPFIDALASQGVRFTNSFATTAICMSSRASILTGMYTRQHQVQSFTSPLANELFEQSYPLLLRKNGYRIGFIGKWGIDGGPLPRSAYDYFQGYEGQGSYFPDASGKHLTVMQADQSIGFLRGCKVSQPFCLAVSFKAPHVQDEGRTQPGIYPKYPYDRSLEKLFANDTVPSVVTADKTPQPSFLFRTLNGTREAPDFQAATYQEAMKSLYRLLSGVDQAVGRISDELKSLGLSDNTVLIYTSDHGSFYGEHGFGGKWLMLEESIRTPLIIFDPRLPLQRRGTTCDQMVLNLDLPATMMELAAVTPPIGIQGKSLMPLIRGESPAWRREWFYQNHFRNQKSIAASEGVRTREWKYIRYVDTTPVQEQLFNLNLDPREENNLAGDKAFDNQLATMRDRWETWNSRLDQYGMNELWTDPV